MSNREMPPLPSKAEEMDVEEIVEKKPKASSQIEVVANARGVYKCSRKVENDRFFVDKFEQLGSWMDCVDPILQKKHMQNMKERNSILREKASKPPKADE